MKSRKLSFVVTVKSDMTWRDIADYIADAVTVWGGQYSGNPDNPDPRYTLSGRDSGWRVSRYVRRTTTRKPKTKGTT